MSQTVFSVPWKSETFEVLPLSIVYQEEAVFKDTYGGDNGPRCAASISKPVLVINNTADEACTPSHAQRLFDGVGHDDKELRHIEGASHYYIGQPEQERDL